MICGMILNVENLQRTWHITLCSSKTFIWYNSDIWCFLSRNNQQTSSDISDFFRSCNLFQFKLEWKRKERGRWTRNEQQCYEQVFLKHTLYILSTGVRFSLCVFIFLKDYKSEIIQIPKTGLQSFKMSWQTFIYSRCATTFESNKLFPPNNFWPTAMFRQRLTKFCTILPQTIVSCSGQIDIRVIMITTFSTMMNMIRSDHPTMFGSDGYQSHHHPDHDH